MQPYIQTKDFTISVPDDWLDNSMQVWSAPPDPKNQVAPNIVASCSKLPPGQAFSTFVNAQMKELMTVGTQVDIHARNPINWQGCPTIELEFSWDNNGTRLKQRQLYIQRNTHDIVSVVFTASEADFEGQRPLFEKIEKNFQWRK